MSTQRLTIAGTIAGQPMNTAISRTGTTDLGAEPPIPAAKAAELTTRTDANTGTFTLASGHGLLDLDVVDVYWSGGARYGMVLGSTGATSTIADGGEGSDLPAEGEDVTICKQVSVDFDFIGNGLVMMGIRCESARGLVHFWDGATREHTIEIESGTQPYLGFTAGELASRFEDLDITHITVSQAGTAAAAIMRIGVLKAA